MNKKNRLPVTLLSGFLGAGKTTVVEQILSQDHDFTIAILVNDMASVNVDYELLKQKHITTLRSEEHLVELSNGCICCSLREELLDEIRKLAAQGTIDYLVIESTGIAEPLPIAEVFSADLEELSLADVAVLDTLVTVVDAREVLPNIRTDKQLADFNLARDENDTRSIAELHLDQIEYADILILNKIDLVDETEKEQLIALLKVCNPDAKIISTTYGKVPLEEILHTGRQEQRPPMLGLADSADPHAHTESEAYDISSFVFRSTLPFHPQRLWDVVHQHFDTVLRSKGVFWLASRPDWIGNWSQAGESFTISTHQRWWAACPQQDWPSDEAERDAILEHWEEPYGDRMNEIVFIGQRMDESVLVPALEHALLTDDERALPMDQWQTFEDPFPPWHDVD